MSDNNTSTTTAPAAGHCGHEPVCRFHHSPTHECPCNKPGLMVCQHDTRSRPHALVPASELAFNKKCRHLLIEEQEFEYLTNQMENDHVEKIYDDVTNRNCCCNCGVPKTADGEPNCNECAFSEEHDNQIRQQAASEATLAENKRVLDELDAKRVKYETTLKGSTSCFDEHDRGLIEGKECVAIILREWIDELRQHKGGTPE